VTAIGGKLPPGGASGDWATGGTEAPVATDRPPDRFERPRLTKRERQKLRRAERRRHHHPAHFTPKPLEPIRAAGAPTHGLGGIDLHGSDLGPAIEARIATQDFAADLKDHALRSKLRELFSPKRTLDYKSARKYLFAFVDNAIGVVRCVYTGRKVATDRIPDAGGATQMNTEHTFPKSWLHHHAGACSDLHHLFPTDTFTNGQRGNHPFGEVLVAEWEGEGGTKLGKDAAGHTVFEPPAAHRGNIARAMFYVATIYGVHLSPNQEQVLRKWHQQDPVDDDERLRNVRVAKVQGNRNPFIDAPDLVARIAAFSSTAQA
jgi:hypothetical protein